MRIGDVFQCPYCRKWVAVKWFLGTTHICLTDEERAKIDQRRSSDGLTIGERAYLHLTEAQRCQLTDGERAALLRHD